MRTAISHPNVSTHRCRLRPVIVLPPSSPRSGPPTSGVLTDGLSMHAARGVGSRPASPRVRSRHALTILAHVPASRHRVQSSETVLLGSQSCGSMSHWHPLRFREKIVLRTSRMSTSRGCPPRGLCLAGGIIGSTMAHCSSVRSEGYFFRDWSLCAIDAHSSTDGICANYLRNLLFCQVIFPDSLLARLYPFTRHSTSHQ